MASKINEFSFADKVGGFIGNYLAKITFFLISSIPYIIVIAVFILAVAIVDGFIDHSLGW